MSVSRTLTCAVESFWTIVWQNTNSVHFCAVWKNTAHVQGIKCSLHVIPWTSAVFFNFPKKSCKLVNRNINDRYLRNPTPWFLTGLEVSPYKGSTYNSAAARRVKKKWTPPHGRTKQNHIFLIQWYVRGTKWMVVKKIFEALPWLQRYSNTVSFATVTPFCAHIFQGNEWSWSDKKHVSGIRDLERAKYVAVMIINTFLH